MWLFFRGEGDILAHGQQCGVCRLSGRMMGGGGWEREGTEGISEDGKNKENILEIVMLAQVLNILKLSEFN